MALRTITATLIATLALALAPSGAAASPGGCPYVYETPTVSVVRAYYGTFCLLNYVRRIYGMAPLRASADLRRAAFYHARDMVRRDYFAHTSLSGLSMVGRILYTGYTSGARSWSVGENIAWGGGPLGSPLEIVKGWLRSPGHRANILNARFREIGIGVAIGTPERYRGATYTTDFGNRG